MTGFGAPLGGRTSSLSFVTKLRVLIWTAVKPRELVLGYWFM
jgi:hypothetical protein